MAKKKGALTTDPKPKEAAPFDLARAERRLAYLQKQRPKDPEIKRLQGSIAKNKLATAPAQTQPAPQTPQQASEGVYGRMAGFAQQFDPNQFQQQYQPQFNEMMQRSYDATMNQFNLRNEKAFQQQKEALDQEAANKGWSPSGENYQRRFRELQDAQNQARQEAQNQAWQQAQGVQQQGYQQALGTAMLPGQIAGQFEAPMMGAIGQQYAQANLGLQQQYAKELAALENKYRLQQIKAAPRGGGQQQPDYFGQYLMQEIAGRYGEQQPQPNPWAQGVQGFTQGVGLGVTQNLMKPTGQS